MNKKTKQNKSVLVNFILDKSGSMGSVSSATISGANEYIKSLKNDKKTDYKFSLTLFDTNIEKRYEAKPIKDVEELNDKTYVPDGMTALYDAVCKTIKDTKELKGQKVITVIMTDGQENSSKEYDEKELKHLIDIKRDWTFLFFGANQDSYATASKYGIHQTNAINFASTSAGMVQAMGAMSNATYNASMSAGTSGFLGKLHPANINITVNS